MIISWNTTNACNMFCDHCYRDAGCKADERIKYARSENAFRADCKSWL